MSDKTRRLYLIIGIVLVVGTVIGVAFAFYNIGKTGTTANGSNVNIVELATPVTKGSQLSGSNLKVVTVPSGEVPVGAITDPNAVVNQYVTNDLPANTVVIPQLLAQQPSQIAAQTIAQPPLDINAGNVAVSVPTDEQTGAGGYIQAEDHIDILVDIRGDGTVKYAFQDIRVLRVGSASQQAGGATSTNASLLVLEMPRTQAEELAFIVGQHGTSAKIIRFVLRPKKEYGKPNAPNLVPSGPLTQGNVQDQPITPGLWNQTFGG